MPMELYLYAECIKEPFQILLPSSIRCEAQEHFPPPQKLVRH
jgi:hypothetical protein